MTVPPGTIFSLHDIAPAQKAFCISNMPCDQRKTLNSFFSRHSFSFTITNSQVLNHSNMSLHSDIHYTIYDSLKTPNYGIQGKFPKMV
jgi:hypothetical protein